LLELLLSLTVTNVLDNGAISWQTASEKNATFMEVQASVDDQHRQVLR